MNKQRSPALLALLSALLFLAPAAAAQRASAAPAQSAQQTAARVGADVYKKLKPATIRIEWRAANDAREPDGLGTGFFISRDGLALTAYHVVFGAPALSAKTVGGAKRLPVQVIGFDDSRDVALVKVGVNGDVPFIPLAEAGPRIGDPALAIGNGGGAFLTDKYGILKALDVAAGRADFPSGTLELDAPLIPGDSGGPIINARGEAVGVVSYIGANGDPNSRGWDSFAVPVTKGSELVADLKSGVKREAPLIGLGFQGDLRDDVFAASGLGPKPGVVFSEVTRNSPADKAGLRPLNFITPPTQARPYGTIMGDVITAIDGKSVRDFMDLMTEVRAHQVGDTIKLTVQRGDKTEFVNVTLAGRAQVEANKNR